MPFVNVRTYKGALSADEKKELQKRITDLMVEFEGKGNREFGKLVWVMIEEEEPENWMLGGTSVKEMLDGNPKFKQRYLNNLKE